MGDNRFNDNFIHSLDRAMSQAIRSSQNAYNAAHSSSSSGSGGGGGFSGGGGGGRRPVAAEADAKIFKIKKYKN